MNWVSPLVPTILTWGDRVFTLVGFMMFTLGNRGSNFRGPMGEVMEPFLLDATKVCLVDALLHRRPGQVWVFGHKATNQLRQARRC